MSYFGYLGFHSVDFPLTIGCGKKDGSVLRSQGKHFEDVESR